MGRDGEATRLALMRAAEDLFLKRGVEAVSLHEIALAAGQRNHSSASYHFGTKVALVDAVLARHSLAIQRRWTEGVDRLEAAGGLTRRALADLLVRPILEKLDDPDGGRAYIALCAQLSVSPSMPLAERPIGRTPEAIRLGRLLQSLSDLPPAAPELAPIHQSRFGSMIYTSIVRYDRLLTTDQPHPTRDAFVADLVDALCGPERSAKA